MTFSWVHIPEEMHSPHYLGSQGQAVAGSADRKPRTQTLSRSLPMFQPASPRTLSVDMPFRHIRPFRILFYFYFILSLRGHYVPRLVIIILWRSQVSKPGRSSGFLYLFSHVVLYVVL